MVLNNELMFSYLDTTTNKLVTIYFDDINNSNSKTIGPASSKEFNDINPATTYNPKKGSFNPSVLDDPYGMKTNSRMVCSSDHSVSKNDDRGNVDIQWFDTKPVYYYGTPVVNTFYVKRSYTPDEYYDQYIIGAEVNLNNAINYYNDVAFADIPCASGSYAYQIKKSPTKDTIYEKFPILFHTNTIPTFGDQSVSEDSLNGVFTITYNNGTIQGLTSSFNGGLSEVKPTIIQKYNSQESTIVGTPRGMKTTYVANDTSYNLKTTWDNISYIINTERTLKADDYILSGDIQLYGTTMLGEVPIAMSGEPIYFQFGGPSTSPRLYDDGIPSLSGYYSGKDVNVYVQPDSTLQHAKAWYVNKSNVFKNVPVTNGSELRFKDAHKDMRGKNMRITATYKTIAGVEELYSEYMCSSFNNYYDIEDVELVLSGIKYDKGLSTNVSYEITYLKESNNKLLYNKIGNKFQTIQDVNARLGFKVKANTTDLDSVEWSYVPAPEKLWLIAVPKTALNNINVRFGFFKVSDTFVLSSRDTYSKTTKFPKLNSVAAKAMALSCTGSAGVPTSDGIIWQDQNLTPIYDAPSVGSFDENTYTINVGLNQNSWAFYLVIKDSTDTYTGYCISNYQKFDIPTSKSFEF